MLLNYELLNKSLLYLSFSCLIFFCTSIFFSLNTTDYSLIYVALFFTMLEFVPQNYVMNGPLSPSIVLKSIKFSVRTIQLTRPPIAFAAIGYAIIITAMTLFNSSPGTVVFKKEIIDELLPLICFLLVLIRLSVDMPYFFKKVFFLLCPVAALSALYSIDNYFSLLNGPEALLSHRLGDLRGAPVGMATGGTATTFALAYAIFSGAAFVLLLEAKNVATRFMLSSAFFILTAALLLTQSRGPIAALILITSVFFAARIKPKYKTILNMIGIFSCIAFAAIKVRGLHDSNRSELFNKFLTLIQENWLIGYGEDIFSVPISNGEFIQHGHNIFLNAELRGGITALIFVTIVFFLGAYRSLVFYRICNEAVVLVVLSIVMVAGLVDFDIVVKHRGWEWITLWFPMGLAAGADALLSKTNETSRPYPGLALYRIEPSNPKKT